MKAEGAPRSPEVTPEIIADLMIEQLGTAEIPFTFRTSNGSVYIADKHARTVRYRATSNNIVNPSLITVFLDHKYMDPGQTDRGSNEYIPNSLANENGVVGFEDPQGKYPSNLIQMWDDLPDTDDMNVLNRSLFFVVGDKTSKGTEIVKKAPLALIPHLGTHPIEIWDPKTHPDGHRNHFGNQIENVTITNRKGETETRKAVVDLLSISLKNKPL